MENKEIKEMKSVPMDKTMIDQITSLIKNHIEQHGKAISFAEASRRVMKAGLDNIGKGGTI